MSYPRTIFLNTFAQVISRFFSIAVSIISVIVLTRYLGTTGYGQFNTALVFVGFLSVLGDLGTYQILIRELSQTSVKDETKRKQILGNVFSWRVISAFLMFVFIVGASRLMPYDQVVKLAIIIESARSSIYLLRIFFVALPQINLRLDLSAWGEILGRFLYLLAVVSIAYFRLNLIMLFIFSLVAFSVETIYMAVVFRKMRGEFRFYFDWSFLKTFLKESLVLGFASVIGNVHFSVDTILLSIMKPAADVGIYSAAYRVFSIWVGLPALFLAAIFPRYSVLAKTINWRNFFRRSLNILWIAAWPFTLFTFIFAPHITQMLGGTDFKQSVIPLSFLSFALLGGFMASGFSQMVIALHKQKQVVLVVFLAMSLNLILNLILIPRFSYKGAAIATLISENFTFLLFAFLFNKFLSFRLEINFLLKSFLPITVLVLVLLILRTILPFSIFSTQTLLLNFVEISTIAAVSFVVYIGVVIILDLIPKNLIRQIIRPSGKF